MFIMKPFLSISLFCLFIGNVQSKSLSSSEESNDCLGAAYTISNAAPNNRVFIFCINKDGRLTRKGTINTNGAGVNTSALDPLNSQARVVVYSDYLFVVNAGTDSVSMFAINPKDPTELKFISTGPTVGRVPVSIAVNSKYVCVLTGGNPAGIRCFTYNRFGLFVVPSFDRTIELGVLQTNPPNSFTGLLSHIIFSADDRALIVTVKGFNTTLRGYLLFYQFTNNFATLSSIPSRQTPTGAVRPFGIALVGSNGLLIADGAGQGVLTMNYSPASGTIQNSVYTPTNQSIINALCWPVYSPTLGNYYVVGAGVGPVALPGIVELHLNLASTSSPVNIIRYYQVPANIGTLDPTIVTVGGVDYLYVIGSPAEVISTYRLDGPGNAVFLEQEVVQEVSSNQPGLAGIAAYLQTRWRSSHRDRD